MFDSLDNSHNYIPKTKCNGKDTFQFDYINSKKESSQNEEINNSNYYDNNPSKFFTSAQPENHDSFNKFNFSLEYSLSLSIKYKLLRIILQKSK